MQKDKEKDTIDFWDEDYKINILDFFIVLAKHKKLIIGITFGVAIIVAIYSITLPSIYLAEAKILPSQKQSAISLGPQLMGQMSGIGGLVGGKITNDFFIGLLQSRPILDGVINRVKLMEVYKTASVAAARDVLLGSLKTQSAKNSGILIIGIENRDPKLAADIANVFIDELKKFNKELALTDASRKRLFFEEQLKDAKELLTKAEESIKSFQEKTGIIKIEDQAAAIIGGNSQLRAQIVAKEMQIKVMRTYGTTQNPDVRMAEEELKVLKEQLRLFESKGSNHDVMQAGNIPSLGTEYLRKMRDLKFNEALYEQLLKQYSVAKIAEAEDVLVIQIIETAIPPEVKVRPKRRQMVVFAMGIGLFLSILAAFLMEYKEKTSDDPENKKRFELFKKYTTLNPVIKKWSELFKKHAAFKNK